MYYLIFIYYIDLFFVVLSVVYEFLLGYVLLSIKYFGWCLLEGNLI